MNSEKPVKYLKLIDTARMLFFKYGIKRVTLQEICEEAHVSKVTFYTYFKNKEELVKLIRDELMTEGFSKFDEINKQDISYIEKVGLMTEWRIGFTKMMNNEFIREVMNTGEIEENIKIGYLNNISAAQSKGEIDPGLAPELIWLVTEKFNEIVKEGKWLNIIKDSSDLQRQLRQMYFFGLLNKETEKNNE